MTRPAPAARPVAPFTVLVDSREQRGYEFAGIRANQDQGGAIIEVPVMRIGLPAGDYSILGYPQICIERKSKEDLYGSVARRENFEGRLARMSERDYAAVVVEADRMELVRNPPPFTRYSPRALSRTLIAWDVRYPVKWHFMPGREAAEVLVYRILERWWHDHQEKDESGKARSGEDPQGVQHEEN